MEGQIGDKAGYVHGGVETRATSLKWYAVSRLYTFVYFQRVRSRLSRLAVDKLGTHQQHQWHIAPSRSRILRFDLLPAQGLEILRLRRLELQSTMSLPWMRCLHPITRIGLVNTSRRPATLIQVQYLKLRVQVRLIIFIMMLRLRSDMLML